MSSDNGTTIIRWLEELDNNDVASVGGKNASLGEMIQRLRKEGIRVPGGFATTADAYRSFLAENDLDDRLRDTLSSLGPDDRVAPVGKKVRKLFNDADMPEKLDMAIRDSYGQLCRREGQENVPVAVRSSATAEDLPDASFAGQQETFLNIRGEAAVVAACQRCYASLFTDRAIAYRREQGFDHLKVALSVSVQRMVRSDRACSGVMFSIDTENGFPQAVTIDGAWGLGETIVQGSVNPDEYRVFKPLLAQPELVPIVEKKRGDKAHKMVYAKQGKAPTKTVETTKKERAAFVLEDQEILQLARWACTIEEHYDRPMDIEWAKDGDDGQLYIVQARPETVQSQATGGTIEEHRLLEEGTVLVTGLAVGKDIASGEVCRLDDPDQGDRFPDGGILVTGMTDPDWGPVMKRAAAIITDHGGRTSHAAIVSRELGVPAVVGTGDATRQLEQGKPVTVSCAEGEIGTIYEGELEWQSRTLDLDNLPEPPVDLMMNIATPQAAFRWWRLPAAGIGLARMEFIINGTIKIHPLACSRHRELEDKQAKKQIAELTNGFDHPSEYFIDHLARGIACIAAAQYPKPVVVRTSDFKTNEYAELIGGAAFEPEEANPMLGFRGASRYYSEDYRDGFALECRALRYARETMGLDNIVIMIPFVRTVAEADRVLATMAEQGLVRGQHGLQVYMMCEIPANVFLAEAFAERFDGFSIGTNDLTQLILGIDRDSEQLRELFDERNEAVKDAIRLVIERCHAHRVPVGICGQAPSDHPDFAAFLLEAGIDSISLNPDSVIDVLHRLAGDRPG